MGVTFKMEQTKSTEEKKNSRIINFNQAINYTNYENGYVRKIISIEENENQGSNHRYGVVKESIYYTNDDCNYVSCNHGDYFIVCDRVKEKRTNSVINVYYLIVIDEKEKNGFRIINCLCNSPLFDHFPYPVNIFVEYLINSGAFKVGR
jgi:hypothetical protein